MNPHQELPPPHLRQDVNLWTLQNREQARTVMSMRLPQLVVMIGARGIDQAIAEPWQEQQDGSLVRPIIVPCGIMPADCMKALDGFTEQALEWARAAHPWPIHENQVALFVTLPQENKAGEPEPSGG